MTSLPPAQPLPAQPLPAQPLPTLSVPAAPAATDYTYGELRPGVVAARSAPVRRSFELDGASTVPSVLLDAAREQARTTGYATGWAQGMREAREQMAADLASSSAAAARSSAQVAQARADVLRALTTSAARLDAAAVPVAAELEELILAAAIEIAQTLLGRELLAGDAVEAVRRVLSLAPRNESVTVRLAPADFAELTANETSQVLDGRADLVVDGRTVTVLLDPTLTAGDAVATAGACQIDGRIDGALERARAAVAA